MVSGSGLNAQKSNRSGRERPSRGSGRTTSNTGGAAVAKLKCRRSSGDGGALVKVELW